MNKICIMGLGYIGLPTAIVATDAGFDVVGFDVDAKKVTAINAHDPVIEEPEISAKLRAALLTGRLRATTKMEQADYFIIAVPTPFKEYKKADLSYIWSAAELLSPVLAKGSTVILESTVPVGTTTKLADFLELKTGLHAGVDFFVAHCPERVLPGKIFKELIYNARIIGGINKASVEKTQPFYERFVKGHLYLTNATTAEMVKLIENSSRDVAIAFAQEVAAMASAVGLDPFEVINLANKHPRVNILNPSCGVGGHCIAVDPWFLVETFSSQTNLIRTAREVNDAKPLHVIKKIQTEVLAWEKKSAQPCKVLILGVTYKPDIDDLRESPALHIAQEVSRMHNIELMVCDPYAKKTDMHSLFGTQATSFEHGVDQADIIVCLVKHQTFLTLTKEKLAHKIVIDTCGLLYVPHTESDSSSMFWPAQEIPVYPEKQSGKEVAL